MTPAPHERPTHRRRHRLRNHASTPPQATGGRHRAADHPAGRGRTFSPRPTTLWPFADAEPLPGTALLAGWLGRTIIALVTGYTQPGDRVLLLTRPLPPTGRSTTPGATRAADPYAGLAEAVWTVTRLGRSVDTATATPPPDHRTDSPESVGRAGYQSGSGPQPARLGLHPQTRPHPDSAHRSDRAEHRPGTGFDLIITAVHPDATDWLSATDWDGTLTPTGMLAVVTHSHRRQGRLVDPTLTIAATFRSQQCGPLDHIAVLSAPLPVTLANPSMQAAVRVPGQSDLGPLPLRSVHHDLLLIGPVSVATSVTAADSVSRAEGYLG